MGPAWASGPRELIAHPRPRPPPPRPHLHDELFLALGPCKACSLPQRPGHRRTLLPHEPERPSAPDLSFCKRRPQPRELGNLLSCTLHVSNAANRLLIFWIFCFACWEPCTRAKISTDLTLPPRRWSSPRKVKEALSSRRALWPSELRKIAAPRIAAVMQQLARITRPASSAAAALAACSAASATRSRS